MLPIADDKYGVSSIAEAMKWVSVVTSVVGVMTVPASSAFGSTTCYPSAPAHVILLEAADPFANRRFDFSMGFHGNSSLGSHGGRL